MHGKSQAVAGENKISPFRSFGFQSSFLKVPKPVIGYVTTIDYEKVQQFYEWRRERWGVSQRHSTLNTHNSAMNRVFEEAVARGFIAHKNVPLLVNRGEKSERRPDFTREEYAT